jgi:hypothetical protein
MGNFCYSRIYLNLNFEKEPLKFCLAEEIKIIYLCCINCKNFPTSSKSVLPGFLKVGSTQNSITFLAWNSPIWDSSHSFRLCCRSNIFFGVRLLEFENIWLEFIQNLLKIVRSCLYCARACIPHSLAIKLSHKVRLSTASKWTQLAWGIL